MKYSTYGESDRQEPHQGRGEKLSQGWCPKWFDTPVGLKRRLGWNVKNWNNVFFRFEFRVVRRLVCTQLWMHAIRKQMKSHQIGDFLPCDLKFRQKGERNPWIWDPFECESQENKMLQWWRHSRMGNDLKLKNQKKVILWRENPWRMKFQGSRGVKKTGRVATWSEDQAY